MIIKSGVVMSDKLVMRPVLLKADVIWRAHGEELVVTSGKDGTHSAGSIHYYGYAYDFRTSYFGDSVVRAVANTLRNTLGPRYNVVIHPHIYFDDGEIKSTGHIHAEYDHIIRETSDDTGI